MAATNAVSPLTNSGTVLPAAPPGVALEDVATRSALAHYRRAAWGWLAFGLALLYPLVLVIGAIEGPQRHSRGLERLTGYLIAGCVLGIASGIVMVRRASRWRSLLSTQPWRAYRARYLSSMPRRAEGGLVLTNHDHSSASQLVLRISAARWRGGRLSSESTVWVCGGSAEDVVVASPVSRELFAAMPPHGFIGRKWRRAHKAKLASLGIELPDVIHRRSLVAAMLFSAVAAFLLFAILGYVIEIAKGKSTGSAFWITAFITCLLAVWMLHLAAHSWSKAE
jgi:hypothetical protein